MIKVVFAGSPDFAVPTLKALIHHPDIEVSLVISQPDRPAGRKRKLTPTAVKAAALESNIEVQTPEKIDAIRSDIQEIDPDFLVVVAYGQILKKSILELPKYAPLNVHASLLPRWRGAAPIHRAILVGDTQTGVAIMHMDQGLDTGPVYKEVVVPITESDTSATLFKSLSEEGAELLVATLSLIVKESLKPKPQSSEGITYAAKITKQEGQIDWSKTAREIDRQIRAFTPWPGTTTTFKNNIIRIKQAVVTPYSGKKQPGEIITLMPDKLIVACGENALSIRELQSSGRASLNIKEWLKGYELTENDRFQF